MGSVQMGFSKIQSHYKLNDRFCVWRDQHWAPSFHSISISFSTNFIFKFFFYFCLVFWLHIDLMFRHANLKITLNLIENRWIVSINPRISKYTFLNCFLFYFFQCIQFHSIIRVMRFSFIFITISIYWMQKNSNRNMIFD